MNTLAHFFDPTLERLYTQQLTDGPIIWKNNSVELRHLFYQLNQAEPQHIIMPKAYNFIQHKLKQVEQNYAAAIIPGYSVDKLTSLQVAKISPLAERLCTQDSVSTWVKQTTAILLTQPCWLQNISPSAASQTLTSIQLMELYLRLTQQDQNGIELAQSYQSMLLATGTKIPSLHSYSFSQQSELIPEILEFASLQLALFRFPRVLLPEILGFTLAYCQLPTPIEVCFPKHKLPGPFFQQRQRILEQQLTPLRQCITAYLDLFPQRIQILWLRIQNGF